MFILFVIPACPGSFFKKDSLLGESPGATRQVDATLRDESLRAGMTEYETLLIISVN
jgi:hypothetical protein